MKGAHGTCDRRWAMVGVVRCLLSTSTPDCTLSLKGGPPIRNLGATGARVDGDWLAYSEWESFQGEDLNGDRDTWDPVVHVRRLSTFMRKGVLIFRT